MKWNAADLLAFIHHFKYPPFTRREADLMESDAMDAVLTGAQLFQLSKMGLTAALESRPGGQGGDRQ